jgi:hypothetical protein
VRQRRHELDRRLGRTDNHNHQQSRIGEAATLVAWGEVLAAQEIVESVAARFANSDPGSPPPLWLGEAQGALLAPLEAAPRSGYAANRWLANVGLRAELQLARGEPQAALQTIDAALSQAAAAPARDSAAAAALHGLAARAALAQGQLETALQRAREAVAQAERVAREPRHSADVGEALLIQARIEQAAGRPDAQTARRAAEALRHGLGASHALTREAQALAATP